MKGDAPERQSDAVERLFADLLRVGENRARLRELAAAAVDESTLIALLRRAVPAVFLEEIATRRPWSERPRVLAQIVQSPRAPRVLSLRLVDSLYWRDLAAVAAAMWLPAPLRSRAEALLRDGLRDMRLGDRIALARLATPALVAPLLADGAPKVVEATLVSPRLREQDLVTALGRENVSRPLLEAVAASARWSSSYAVRVALVLQPRTPLAIALQQISALVPRDLRRVAEEPALHPLVRSACRSLLEGGS